MNYEALLVKDNDSDISNLKKSIKAAKFIKKIHVVKNKQEIIDALKVAKRPIIVLLDLSSKNPDLISEIREIDKYMPIILLTEIDEEIDHITAKELNLVGYIEKPLQKNSNLFDRMNLFGNFWGISSQNITVA